MKALLKMEISINVFYGSQSWLGKPMNNTCFKPGNPDYNMIFHNLDHPMVFPNPDLWEFLEKLYVKLDTYLANGDILPEIFPEDRFEIDEEKMMCNIFQRWERKEALQEYVKWRWTEINDPSTIFSYEVIELPSNQVLEVGYPMGDLLKIPWWRFVKSSPNQI